MYGSGGSRGSRGGHRGRSFFGHQRGGAGRRGPALPSSLLRELGGDGDSSAGGFRAGHGGRRGAGRSFEGRGRGRGRDSRSGGRVFVSGSGGACARGVNARDANGSEAKKRPAERSTAPAEGQQQGGDAGALRLAKRQRASADSGPEPRAGGLTRTLAAMKQRETRSGSGPASGPASGSGSGVRAGSGAGSSSKTKFHELLADGWESRNGWEAFLEELRLQARLAKRLGKKSKKEALDGMDKLMGCLSAGSESLLPKYLDSRTRQEAEDLLARSGSEPGAAGGDLDRTFAALAKGTLSAAAAARQAEALLDRESDEELEYFGIEPGTRDSDAEEEDGDDEDDDAFGRRYGLYGFGSRSDSSGDESGDSEEGEEEGKDSDDDGDAYGSDHDDDSRELESDDEQDDGGGDVDEEEGEGEDEGYDMLSQLMGSDSDDGMGTDGDADEEEETGEVEEREERRQRRQGGESLSVDEHGSGGSSEDGSEQNGEEEGDEGDVEEEDDVEPVDEDAEEGRQGNDLTRKGATAAAGGAGAGQKYVPPALRAQMAAAAAGVGRGMDVGRVQVERRITGLINRLTEANLQPISRDVTELYRNQGRRLVSEAVAAQILGAAESGPRASEQFAAVAAAFVAAVAALAEAQDLAAGFLAALAERLEGARNSEDSLAQSNLVTLLAYCYSAGLVGPGLCYSLLGVLKERFQEADVSAMVTLLNAVGLQLRNADPALMKEFVLGVHERAAQLGRDGQLSRRAQLMLDLIIDIKNNKTSAAGGAAAAAAPSVSLGGTAARKGKAGAAAGGGAGGGGRRGGALAVLQPSVAKWLQQLGVEEVCLRGLSWQKLLAPNKKGMWWMPIAGEALDDPLLLAAVGGADGSIGAAAAGGGSTAAMAAAAAGASSAKLLQLAAAQRMNTDARRAVFVAIMGSEDCAEAHEKLLRLPLKGDQRREISRVLVDCCLGEKSWNPYYAFLALRLCGGGEGAGAGGGGSVGRAHRVTLQYCLWDKLKELQSMDVRQLTHLAKLAALLVARFSLSLSFLKVVDWSDLSAKQLLTWRIFLQHLLSSCKAAGDVKEIFARVSSQPKTLSALICGLLLFLRSSFAPWAATKLPPGPDSDELLRRTRVAEKELSAGASVAAAVLI